MHEKKIKLLTNAICDLNYFTAKDLISKTGLAKNTVYLYLNYLLKNKFIEVTLNINKQSKKNNTKIYKIKD